MKGDLKVSTDDFLAELKQTYTIAAAGLDRLAPTMLGDTRDSLEALISSFEQNEADTAAAFDNINKQAQA